MVTYADYDPNKTQVFQTNAVAILCIKKAHFQVDSEYFGKVNSIVATLIPHALRIIIPS